MFEACVMSWDLDLGCVAKLNGDPKRVCPGIFKPMKNEKGHRWLVVIAEKDRLLHRDFPPKFENNLKPGFSRANVFEIFC